jgi:anthranilate phosphoribosyltransferase
MSDISQVLKALSSGSTHVMQPGATESRSDDVEPLLLKRAFAAVLDGGTSDLETGALMGAAAVIEGTRDAERYAPLLLALMEVVQERLSPLEVPGSSPLVVLPNYSDSFCRPKLALLGLLLRRIGVKVLLHGALETNSGLFTSGVLREFGILPATSRGQAANLLAQEGICLAPTTLFSPGLAGLLSLRNRLGVTTPGHHLANLLVPLVDQAAGTAHVLDVSAWLKPMVDGESCFTRVPALMAVYAEVEASALPAPMILHADTSRATWTTLYGTEERRTVSNAQFTGVPDAWDTKAWAAWTQRMIEGKTPLPSSQLHMLAACLFACGYARDLNEAKAVAAMAAASGGGLAAA